MKQVHPQSTPVAQAQPTAPYQPPRVQDLGAWQAVTLINSVPINPGAMFNPDGSPRHGTY